MKVYTKADIELLPDPERVLRFVNADVAEAEVARLKSELVELLEECINEIGCRGKDDRVGWTFSMGRRTVCDAGDRLVEMGLWERHPRGVGKTQWYRRKPTEEEPDE